MMANGLISAVTGVQLHDYGCSLKVFRAEIVKPMKLYGEMHRFLPAIASEQASSIAEMVVNHRARKHGQSKYGIGRTVRVDARSADREVPAELLDAAAADLRADRLRDGAGRRGDQRRGWRCSGCARSASLDQHMPLLLFGILLIFTGVQLVTLGLLAELQARTYHESQNKPTYVIREILQTPAAERARLDQIAGSPRCTRQIVLDGALANRIL